MRHGSGVDMKPSQRPKSRTEQSTEPVSETALFAVVAVGASAGGLEAFTQLLRSLPGDVGMAFVFIQHLDPTHHSMLAELLSKSSSLPVIEAKNRAELQPNCVYVIPPNVKMGILQNRLQLTPREEKHLHLPIDFFMRSLAEERKEKAVGVVLSGTGSDGTLGLAAIKGGGGITFAQEAKFAKYDGMPRSAIASGCADFVLTAEDIAKELVRIARHPYFGPPRAVVKRKKPEKDRVINPETALPIFLHRRDQSRQILARQPEGQFPRGATSSCPLTSAARTIKPNRSSPGAWIWVSPLTDAQQLALHLVDHCPGYEPEPGGKLPSLSERCPVSDGRHDRS